MVSHPNSHTTVISYIGIGLAAWISAILVLSIILVLTMSPWKFHDLMCNVNVRGSNKIKNVQILNLPP